MNIIRLNRLRIRLLVLWGFPLFLVIYPFVFYLPNHYADRVHSYYYSLPEEDLVSLVRRAFDLNDGRLRDANGDLSYVEYQMLKDSRNPNKVKVISEHNEEDEHFDLVVAVITTSRDDPTHFGPLGYLTQTLAALHAQIHGPGNEFLKIKPLICNVEYPSSSHVEAFALSEVFTMVERFDEQEGGEDNSERDLFEKEKNDYLFCLGKANQYNSDYVAVLEDDAVPTHDFLEVLHDVLAHRLERQAYRDETASQAKASNQDGESSWLFLKLYYPQKWAGYSFKVEHVLELLGIAILGGTLFSFLAYFTPYGRGRTTLQKVMPFVFGAIYCIVLVTTIGRPYVIEWRRWSKHFYSLGQSPGCCTQATVFPSHTIGGLARFLASKTCNIDYAKDLAIEDYKTEHAYAGYLVEPNLVKHIGMVSSLRPYGKEAAEYIH